MMTLFVMAIAILVAVATIVLLFFVWLRDERSRDAEYQALADRLGGRYSRKDDGSVKAQLDSFQLLSGSQRTLFTSILRVLRGEYGKYAITCFLHTADNEAVLIISSDDLRLPEFVLIPADSEWFFIQGSDKSAIRDTLNCEFMETLLTGELYGLEGADGTLLVVWKPTEFLASQLEVGEIQRFLERGCTLARLLEASRGTPRT